MNQENIEPKLKVKLKQHSMMIHFQADQRGSVPVCLRASEVKPKLDRFIVKKLGGSEKVVKEHKEWIQSEHLNGKDVALKYRMTITHIGGAKVYQTDYRRKNRQTNQKDEFINGRRNPDYIPLDVLPAIYYGNMGGNTTKKYGVWFKGDLNLTILCFDSNLMNIIKECIADFFIATNFGTMQSKGFGSFMVSEINNEKIEVDVAEALKSHYGAERCFKIEVNQGGDESGIQNELFDTIKQVYSVMKSGQNIPNIPRKYIRSFIYVYMHDKEIGNEKAYMKDTGVAPIRDTHNDESHRGDDHENARQAKFNDTQFCYVRAVLGIGDKIEWLEDERDEKYFGRRNIKERVSITHIPKGEKEKIERCSSPVFFKVVEGVVYFTANNVNTDIYGEWFKFKNEGYTTKSTREKPYDDKLRNGEENPNSKNPSPESAPEYDKYCELPTPENFDMADFLGQFKNYYNQNLSKLHLKFEIEEV